MTVTYLELFWFFKLLDEKFGNKSYSMDYILPIVLFEKTVAPVMEAINEMRDAVIQSYSSKFEDVAGDAKKVDALNIQLNEDFVKRLSKDVEIPANTPQLDITVFSNVSLSREELARLISLPFIVVPEDNN